ncbi:MAG TPA: hypothetical protein VGG14_08270 [Candidatus Sulfotelmatobacter sp.]|jgi:hypothetical protein
MSLASVPEFFQSILRILDTVMGWFKQKPATEAVAETQLSDRDRKALARQYRSQISHLYETTAIECPGINSLTAPFIADSLDMNREFTLQMINILIEEGFLESSMIAGEWYYTRRT